MVRVAILLILTFLLSSKVHAQNQDQSGIKELLARADSVKEGQSIYNRIKEAIRFTESYIAEKIGKDNFLTNYKFDSTFNDILWITQENGIYTKHSKPIKNDDRYAETIQDYSDDLRLVYHYNFAYKNIQYPKKGFGLYVQLVGDKSKINVQGLINITKDRNLTSILTREEVLEKIRKTRFKREIRKSIKKNITVNQITYDFDQFKGEPFEKIYYTILLRDIKEPAFYKFDPWTGELCCVMKTKIN